MRSIVLTGSTEETAQAVLKVRARVRPNTTVVRLGDGAVSYTHLTLPTKRIV